MQELVYVQAAMAHLAMALKILDRLGAQVPAAHIDAALHSLSDEPAFERAFPEIRDHRDYDKTLFGQIIEDLYGNSPRLDRGE